MFQFQVHKWSWWSSNNLHLNSKYWCPPEAWHSKHFVSFWKFEENQWSNKCIDLSLCKLIYLNTTLPLLSLISMCSLVGSSWESPSKIRFSFSFSVLEFDAFVNLDWQQIIKINFYCNLFFFDTTSLNALHIVEAWTGQLQSTHNLL